MSRCERCGTPGRVERHHPTGRVAGIPIHCLVVGICPDCHINEGAVWHAAGLEHSDPGLAILLRRLAVWLGRWPHGLRRELVHGLAEVLDDLAERAEAHR
jgi:hypothetical protein